MNPHFWRGKRVFLTGHTGFKGSWLSLWLQELGANVTGFALPPPTTPSLFEMACVGNQMDSTLGDIRDAAALTSALLTAQPEIVIHMAAQPLVRYSYEYPVETYSTNVMGLVNLFEAVRASSSVRAVLNITTDKCYENREWVWGYRETDSLGGYDPYSSSKACAELVTAAYRSSYFSNKNQPAPAVATARAGNVIGGGDWAKERLVPDILNALTKECPVVIRNPHAIRPWQHVLEPLRGYLMLAERLYTNGADFAQPWNFGPEHQDAKPVSWIAEQMTQLWDNKVNWIAEKSSQPHETKVLKLDTSKAHSVLNWQPALDIKKALTLVIQWHQVVTSGKDARKITVEQITSYQNEKYSSVCKP